MGVSIVELGHSERRHVLRETDDMINRKVLCAEQQGLTILLCVGETAEEKARGLADEVLRTQLKAGLYRMDPRGAERLWVAYEPAWAIGENGVPASSAYARERHTTLRRTLTELYGPERGSRVPLLYGGSVHLDNAVKLSQEAEIDGLFIGRSAWDARNFTAIIREVLAAG